MGLFHRGTTISRYVIAARALPVQRGWYGANAACHRGHGQVLERGLRLGKCYAIVRVQWSLDAQQRVRLVCHNPFNSQEGTLVISDLQLQLAMQVDAAVLVSTRQRATVAEQIIRCLRWDGDEGPVTFTL